MGEDLILASASPTRARLLIGAGVTARLEPPDVDEGAVEEAFQGDRRAAVDCALALAEIKAQIASRRNRRALVIGADQILVSGSRWFDKPVDLDAARTQLRGLRGLTHELATAVCVVQGGARVWHAMSLPKLTMRPFSDAFIESYLTAEGASILGSVGAYRLEGRGAQLFSRIEGDHYAILGLPLLELLGFLRDRGELLS